MNRLIQKKREQTFRLVSMGIFSALAYATTLLPHIKVDYLTLDVKDAVIVIAAFLFGPASGCGISLVVSLLEMITVSGTGPWGALMNFVASSAYSCVAGIVYQKHKNVKGAVLGLYIGSLAMISTMMVMNLIITPIYFPGMTTIDVMKLIPTLLLPFNAIKALCNTALTLLIYKPVSLALKRANLAIPAGGDEANATKAIPGAVKEKRMNPLNTAEAILIAVVSFAFALVIYLFLLRGQGIVLNFG